MFLLLAVTAALCHALVLAPESQCKSWSRDTSPQRAKRHREREFTQYSSVSTAKYHTLMVLYSSTATLITSSDLFKLSERAAQPSPRLRPWKHMAGVWQQFHYYSVTANASTVHAGQDVCPGCGVTGRHISLTTILTLRVWLWDTHPPINCLRYPIEPIHVMETYLTYGGNWSIWREPTHIVRRYTVSAQKGPWSSQVLNSGPSWSKGNSDDHVVTM